jgi:hypothetical protein
MTRIPSWLMVVIALVLAVLGGSAISAQEKYIVQVPGGLAFSDFRGYENWEDVAVSQTEDGIKVIVANPVMMAAYRDGLPANGKKFADGSKIAKIEWSSKKNSRVPLLRDGTRYSKIGFVHRKGYQEISRHERIGIRAA